MFGRDKNKIANEKVLYEARPSFLISCSSILFAMIVLGILFYAYTAGIKMVGNMSVFLISSIKAPITSYYALAILILMIFVILYIVWKILSWSTVKYKITNYRVIVKKGVITEDKTYMPFNTIQDIGVSKGILGRLISVGTLTLYSAYDGKNVELKNIFSPNKVEDLIFENMRNSALQPRNLYGNPNNYENSSGSSVTGGIFSRLKEKENEVGARNMGNIYHQDYDDIVPEHNYTMSDAPINDISDLDDLELVDVKERKRNLRELRKQANRNRHNYNNSRNYNSQYQNNRDNFQSPYNKTYDSDLDDYEYINGPSHYSKQNQQNHYNQSHNQYNSNYPSNNYNQGYQDNYSNQRDYSDYSNQGNFNQNYQNHNQNQEYADMYIQDVSPEGYETYEPVHNDSIRDSYRRNPDKYFADNYEKFHENNLRSKSQDYDEYELSDDEFDRTVMEANRNLNNKNIMFRGQKSNYYDDEFTNELVNDFNPNYDNRNYGSGNYRNSNHFDDVSYDDVNYGSGNYRNSNHFDDVSYNNRNHSNRRNNSRKNYNNYNKNRNYNKNKNYNNKNYHKKNQRYNNRYDSNHNSNSNYNNYSSDYPKGDYENKTAKDVIKNHSRKFDR